MNNIIVRTIFLFLSIFTTYRDLQIGSTPGMFIFHGVMIGLWSSLIFSSLMEEYLYKKLESSLTNRLINGRK